MARRLLSGLMVAACLVAATAWAVTCQSAPRTASSPDASPASTPTGSNMDVAIEWSVTPADGGKKLRITYTVTNRSAERLWLCDLLLTQENNKLIRVPDRVIVMNGEKDGQVLFARARVAEHVPSSFPRNPGARAFDPGKTLDGSADVPLPLTAWHNYGFAQPIKGHPRTAVLELSYIKGDATWVEQTLSDGSKIVVPQPPTHLLDAWGEEKPIPRG